MPAWQTLLVGFVIGVVVVLVMGRSRPGPPRRPLEPARPLAPEEIARIRDLALAGKKIEAIKLYRLATGVGLVEAKAFVESL
jgi:hypothetical protein